MWKVLSLDNCLRITISTLSGVLAVSLAPVIGTGYFSFLVPVTLYFLCEWIFELVVARKDQVGGWSLWLASWIMPYRGLKTWSGGDLGTFEERIPDSLMCGIALPAKEMVVDPVRSIRTGQLYERQRLYDWLNRRHTDPLTREKACSIDYIDSPLAAEHAKRIGRLLGAEAKPT
uniref:U-box domain-containing protein n=1 Tax=Photinus pyralis TaxID=7054 RepID=A0A1Y1M517_PHOPY